MRCNIMSDLIKNSKYVNDEESFNQMGLETHEKYKDAYVSPDISKFLQTNLLNLNIKLSRYKFIMRMSKKTDRILDIGSGFGLGATFLGQNVKEVVGVDVSPYRVDEATKMCSLENVSFKLADMVESAYGEKFDVVTNLDVIEHMDEPLGIKLVENCAKSVKKDGMFILGTPSWYIRDYQGPESKAGHVRMYKQEELLEIMDKYFDRCLPFSMNDELVHTGNSKTAWYYFIIGFGPKV